MLVTTSERPVERTVTRARQLAAELQAAFVPRRNMTLRGMQSKYSADGVLVVMPKELRYVSEGLPPLFFHPSMALIRVKRLRDGGNDALVTVSGLQRGDSVLDCTAGLCSDSLVLSYAAGPEGKVIAVEASPILHTIVREGLQTYETGFPDIDAAMRRIEPLLGFHDDVLEKMKDNSVDIVYFDPMFELAVGASTSMKPLRSQAHGEPLSETAVRNAVRVARKKVVLKDHRDSGQFERLGFDRIRVSTSAVAYGVIHINE
ncbi:SAM-dependent methyltransferase [Cohnella kolymensis]|uniref:SAM-dependent methyltransferase n=2 Tax=Cohnella kolymensis TaxID=1590652 RepID=A0ABR5A1G2_9BACL|nr:SAM-dependent methyltransferase [Cohnella kolymensis]